jgi:hypothetical protein
MSRAGRELGCRSNSPCKCGKPEPLASRRVSNHVGVTTIKRLDQGHLYPLGEHRYHVTGGARTSAPLHRRRPLYLKSYLDSYSEPLLGLRPVLHSVLCIWPLPANVDSESTIGRCAQPANSQLNSQSRMKYLGLARLA